MTNTREIILSNEHIGYAWKDYNEAMDQLTYKSAKNLLIMDTKHWKFHVVFA